jgi:ketosteroid isomerase-like protein
MTKQSEAQIRELLEAWASATRQNRKHDVLKHHSPDLVMFDVLAPMKYESAEAYRKSWGDWQPETEGECQFHIEDLVVRAESDVAFAYCFIRCGGTKPDGKTFSDLVRATFCLQKESGKWMVAHQHVSKPLSINKS